MDATPERSPFGQPLAGGGAPVAPGASDSVRVPRPMKPRLSIVIVTWNVAGLIDNCLDSVLRSDIEGGTEVIVVDNNSTDGTAQAVRDRFPGIHLLPQSENLGFPAANNIGILSATSDLILLLNPDTIVAPDALRLAVTAAEQHSMVGIVGCRLVCPEGTVQYECARRLPALVDPIVETFYLHVLLPRTRLFGRHLMSFWDHSTDRLVECISGAFMLLKRELIDGVGLLDDRFFMYYEDLEYCARARRRGWQVFYCSGAVVTHHSGASRRQSSIPFDYLRPDIRYTYFRDYRGRVPAELYRVLAGVQAVARLLISGAVRLLLPRRLSGRFATASRPGVHSQQFLWCVGARNWRGLGRQAQHSEIGRIAS